MARKLLIDYEITYNFGEYEIRFFQDLAKANGVELIESAEKFIKKVKKYKEIVGNQVILDILRNENIVCDKLTTNDIESALKRLFKKKHKKIEIVPLKAPIGCEIYQTLEFGNDIYLTEDNFIACGERIKVWET